MDPLGGKRDGMHNMDGRRAAHVKWDGKTIALGTFSAMEAVEKCERAKALTKKWRATMVPKPDVEWVKKALEKLNIRVVNDRPGRRRKDEILEKERKKNANALLGPHMIGGEELYGGLPSMARKDKNDGSMFSSFQQGFPPGMSSAGPDQALGMSSMNAAYGMAGMAGGNGNARLPSGNMSGGGMSRRFSHDNGPGLSQFNPMQMGNNLPSNFENNMGNMGNMGRNPYQQGILSRDFGMNSSGKIPGLDSPGSSRQHYGVLKEHHDNLLKELQQTTYMMQMYQQNYEQQEESSVGNFMNGSVYGSNSIAAGQLGPRRDPLGSYAQGQGLQEQGFNNSMRYQFDRRNSLGLAEPSMQRGSMQSAMQNPYSFSSASGSAGLQMQGQHGMMLPDVDRMGQGGNPMGTRSPSRRQSAAGADINDSKPGANASSSGYASPKQEEV